MVEHTNRTGQKKTGYAISYHRDVRQGATLSSAYSYNLPCTTTAIAPAIIPGKILRTLDASNPVYSSTYLRALKDRQGLRRSSVSRRGGFGRPLVDVIELDQHRYPRVEPEQSLLKNRGKKNTRKQFCVAAGCIGSNGACGC